jgi:hypothetical protein
MKSHANRSITKSRKNSGGSKPSLPTCASARTSRSGGTSANRRLAELVRAVHAARGAAVRAASGGVASGVAGERTADPGGSGLAVQPLHRVGLVVRSLAGAAGGVVALAGTAGGVVALAGAAGRMAARACAAGRVAALAGDRQPSSGQTSGVGEHGAVRGPAVARGLRGSGRHLLLLLLSVKELVACVESEQPGQHSPHSLQLAGTVLALLTLLNEVDAYRKRSA